MVTVPTMPPDKTIYFPFEKVAPFSPYRCLRFRSSFVLALVMPRTSIRLINNAYYLVGVPSATRKLVNNISHRFLMVVSDNAISIPGIAV